MSTVFNPVKTETLKHTCEVRYKDVPTVFAVGKASGNTNEFSYATPCHSVSWKVYASKAQNSIRVTVNAERDWISFDCTESYESDSGKSVEKKVFVNIHHARHLYEQLRRVFEAE